ncbi:MAG: hypothetical protein ACR2IF_01125 [Terriglobales bacterium]
MWQRVRNLVGYGFWLSVVATVLAITANPGRVRRLLLLLCIAGVAFWFFMQLPVGDFLAVEQARQAADNTVVVRVFRDSKAAFRPEFDRKLWEFNDQKHRTASGKYLLAATMETLDYRKDLREKAGQVQPQIVVLDSPADGALVPELGGSIASAKNACSAQQQCLAFIPHWVHGDELTGARTLLGSLSAR